MERTKEEIEKEIIKFLDESSSKKSKAGIACALGTSKDNIPRVTPIDFFNDGLILWIVAGPGEKLGNIRSNPNVSVGIYTRVRRSKENRSVMLKGKASLITYREQKDLYMEVITKFGMLDIFKKAIRSSVFEKQPAVGFTPSGDFETKLDKLLHRETVIKVEPEIIALLILPSPGGIIERLVWEKEG